MLSNIESLNFFLPEIFLSSFIILLLIGSFFRKNVTGENIKLNYYFGLILLTITLLIEIATFDKSLGGTIFMGMLKNDAFAHVFKIIFIFSAIFLLFYSLISNETNSVSSHTVEYVLLILSLTLGMMLMAGASNLLMLYISMEFLGLTSYLLTGFIGKDQKYSEAAIKYLLYGGVATGVMIYGLSLLYGITGSLDYSLLAASLKAGSSGIFLLTTSIILIFAGFGYKIAAFPFHSWCPDVYEGAPTPLTSFLSVGSKAAGFAIVLRFFYEIFAASSGTEILGFNGVVDWSLLIAVFSAFTMTFGNLAALHQNNVKRMLAYSSIAHAGYMLMTMASSTKIGISYITFYLVFYFIMNFGAFLVVIIISNQMKTESISDYEGLAWKNKYGAYMAVVFSIFLFSLTGLPPFAGFIGKFYLFLPLFYQGSKFMWLAGIGIINTVISLYYYMRIVRNMFLRSNPENSNLNIVKPSFLEVFILSSLSVFTIVFGIYWMPILNFCYQTMSLF